VTLFAEQLNQRQKAPPGCEGGWEGAITQGAGATAWAGLGRSKTQESRTFSVTVPRLPAGAGGRADLPGNSPVRQQAASPTGRESTSFSFSAFGEVGLRFSIPAYFLPLFFLSFTPLVASFKL